MGNKTNALRRRAFLRQGGRCHYCDSPMWLESPDELGLDEAGATRILKCTAEHVIAREDGGLSTQDNIVAACWFCNATRHRRRKKMPSPHYRRHVQHRVSLGKWHRRHVAGLLGTAHP